MAISNYAFQARRWNNRHDDLQTLTGLYGSWSGTTFIGDSCPSGFLANKGDGIPAGGFYFTTASDGSDTLYACDPTDIQRVSVGDNLYAVGVETLGLIAPADRRAPFTEIKKGETYAFGVSNFSTLVDASNPVATVSDGLLVGASELDSSFAGWYFEIDKEMGIDAFIEANYVAGSRYNLVAKYI